MVLSGVPPHSLAARHGRALLGEGSPSPFPPSSATRVRRALQFGRGLYSVSSSAVSLSLRSLLGVLSPPSFSRCGLPCPVAHWPSSSGAGPVLAWPPTNAAVASLQYSRRWCASLSVVAMAAPVKCADGCPAPPVPSAVSFSASSIFVAPRGAAPSPPSVGALPGVSGGGWVLVPSPPPLSVLPLSGSGRCGRSQGFDSPRSPIFSGGRVIP